MTEFSVTFSSLYNSLVLVAGGQLLDDVTELHITRPTSDGDLQCSFVRANGGNPTRLVAAVSREGRQAMERANGQTLSAPAIPGFVELSSAHQAEAVRDAIARHLGATAGIPSAPPQQGESLRDTIARHLGFDSKPST